MTSRGHSSTTGPGATVAGGRDPKRERLLAGDEGSGSDVDLVEAGVQQVVGDVGVVQPLRLVDDLPGRHRHVGRSSGGAHVDHVDAGVRYDEGDLRAVGRPSRFVLFLGSVRHGGDVRRGGVVGVHAVASAGVAGERDEAAVRGVARLPVVVGALRELPDL